jgi:hypothetical protein
MEEVWSYLSDDQYELHSTEDEEVESAEEALAISVQAMKGTKGGKSFRLRGFWANQEVYMLVDSGSTNCFISEHLAAAEGRFLYNNLSLSALPMGICFCVPMSCQISCGLYKGSPSRLLSRYCH